MIVLECRTSDEMMRWVLALRSSSFQNDKLSMAKFDIISVIGRGFYGKVMLVREHNTGGNYAIKSIKKSQLVNNKKIHTVLAERGILGKVDHPFIVSMKFAFQTPGKFYFGLEYAQGGELFYHMQRLGTFPIQSVRLYTAEIALALQHLHQHGIIYRDLKPENVLLDCEGHIKLTDFGLSKDLGNAEALTTTFCGTADYLAPELVKHEKYGVAVDWWGLGVLCYEMLFGKTPFGNGNTQRMFRNICTQQPDFPPETKQEVRTFISSLLTKEPKKRLRITDIAKHAFFCGLNFDDVLNRRVTPTFVPEVGVPSNFDRQFTTEEARDSITMPVAGSLGQVNGFSYAEDMDI